MQIHAWSVVALCGLVLSCSAASGDEATRVWIPDTRIEGGEIIEDKSERSGFTLVLKREMPTPGWTFRIDSVEVDAESQRLTAKLTEVGPEGIVAQVLTPSTIEVPLGKIDPGTYFVELWFRRDPNKRHQPGHAVVVIAR
jgi:hypothetical protein